MHRIWRRRIRLNRGQSCGIFILRYSVRRVHVAMIGTTATNTQLLVFRSQANEHRVPFGRMPSPSRRHLGFRTSLLLVVLVPPARRQIPLAGAEAAAGGPLVDGLPAAACVRLSGVEHGDVALARPMPQHGRQVSRALERLAEVVDAVVCVLRSMLAQPTTRPASPALLPAA